LLTLRGTSGPRRGPALGELGLIHDGSLLIRDGEVVEVGPTRRVENLAEARKAFEINAAGRVVMPGFVDSHTHLAFPPPGAAGLDVEAAAREIRATNGQRLEWRARGYLQAMVRHGTTTVEVKTGCGPDEKAEIKILRVLWALKRVPLDVIPTYLFRLPAAGRGDSAEADWAFRELMPKIRRRGLAAFADVAWETGAERLALMVRCLEVARELGFPRKVHADQPNAAAAIQAAVEGMASTIDHLEWATAAEAGMLAGSSAIATLLPYASFQSGGPGAPARALIDAGVPVAIASNFNPLLTPAFNMQTVVALACLRMRMTPAEAISAATINGAHAVGRASRTGSLEPGKLADLLILDASDYQELARRFGVNLVRLTMKCGQAIYKEGAVSESRADSTRLPDRG
jgi:imidazolonepropionase